MLRRRYSLSFSRAAVERDLGVIFGIFVGFLNAGAYLILLTGGNPDTPFVKTFLVIGAGNVGASLVLWRARTSISRAWRQAGYPIETPPPRRCCRAGRTI